MSRLALYFGHLSPDSRGHFLRCRNERNTLRPRTRYPGFPWDIGELDGGLLRSAKVRHVEGPVLWTCAGIHRTDIWHAFCWWDDSGSALPRSNSGFYVRGFASAERDAAFALACDTWPEIVARQRSQLVLMRKAA